MNDVKKGVTDIPQNRQRRMMLETETETVEVIGTVRGIEIGQGVGIGDTVMMTGIGR